MCLQTNGLETALLSNFDFDEVNAADVGVCRGKAWQIRSRMSHIVWHAHVSETADSGVTGKPCRQRLGHKGYPRRYSCV
jgi:hypothetical protein